MRGSLFAAVAALATTSLVSAHGNITSPPARLPGPAMVAACGQEAVDIVLSDGTIALEELTPATPACKPTPFPHLPHLHTNPDKRQHRPLPRRPL